MGAVAYLFPGQGAQKVGMGFDLFQRYPVARAVFQEADATLGYPLSQLCFQGPADKLRQTVYTQPAVFVVSYACLSAAQALGILPSDAPAAYVAGHSLGEYTAALAAGSLTFSEALKLVHQRASLMEKASRRKPGSMVAVLGMEMPALEAICKETGVQIANINSPEQVVLSGPADAISQAISLAEKRGAKRIVPLEVGGAFHSRLMVSAQEGMVKALESTTLSNAKVPIVANASAQPVSSPQEIKLELQRQVCSPVQWLASIEYMATQGVAEFVEIGPGRVLSGLVKRIVPDAKTWNLSDLSSIEAAQAA